jgi:hypothetical protein
MAEKAVLSLVSLAQDSARSLSNEDQSATLFRRRVPLARHSGALDVLLSDRIIATE